MPNASKLPDEAMRWAAQAVSAGASVQSIHPLAGATSSTLYALDIVQGASLLPCVLRLYDNTEWLAEEPDVPRREAAILQRVFQDGLAVPELIACDPTGAASGGVPLLLMTRLPGTVVLVPDNLNHWLFGLAEALLPVHAVSADGLPWQYRPYADLSHLTPPAWSRVPRLWEQAIEIAQEPPPPAPECLIHRDYHPNNVLWQNGKVSGIVDWPNGCRGNANVDVAWCRFNLMYVYGVPIADQFLSTYQNLAGASFAYHPYWDILALTEALPGPPRLYPPWAEFGITYLTEALLRDRIDDHLKSVLARF